MPTSYFIGLDLGTTSAKACAFDSTGKLLTERIAHYPLAHPEPGAAVQDPAVMVEKTADILASVIAGTSGECRSIAISTAMHGVLLLDEAYEPLGPIITWADVRAQSVLPLPPPSPLRPRPNEAGKLSLAELTGTPIHPMSPLVKLRWLTDHHPERLRAATYFGDLKTYLINRWTTAGHVLDEQLASATGLLDVATGEWAAAALHAAGQDDDAAYRVKFPKVVPVTTQLEWRPEIAAEFGAQNIPLFIGGSDGCLANIGSGLLTPGHAAVTIGTSGAVRITHRQARPDYHGQTLFNYRIKDDYFALGGASNNGGKAIEWIYELLSAHFEDIGDLLTRAAAHETDLVFRPFLNGERAPAWDATATAAFENLRGHHGPLDLARAVLDGVTKNICTILRHVEAASGPVRRIYASGGFTRSPEWLQLLADYSGREVVVASTPQASAYGAALVGRLAVTAGATLTDIAPDVSLQTASVVYSPTAK